MREKRLRKDVLNKGVATKRLFHVGRNRFSPRSRPVRGMGAWSRRFGGRMGGGRGHRVVSKGKIKKLMKGKKKRGHGPTIPPGAGGKSHLCTLETYTSRPRD